MNTELGMARLRLRLRLAWLRFTLRFERRRAIRGKLAD